MGNDFLKKENLNDEESDPRYQDFPQKNKYRAQRRALMKKCKDRRYSLLDAFEPGPQRDRIEDHLKYLQTKKQKEPINPK